MSFSLPILSDYKREKLTACAMRLLESQQQLHAEHQGLHAFMLANSLHEDEEPFTAMRHYPKGDRIDYESGGQYFYHCHRENFETEEHGHFHVFIRASGWPKSYRLPAIPERDKYSDNPMTHVISIGLNRHGQPIRLFTVNRWVSQECWFEAERLRRMSQKFSLNVQKNEQWKLLDDWIENLVHLFMPQTLWLQQQRDEMVKDIVSADPYHDTDFEELSSLSINLEQQIQWLMQ